MFRSTRLTFNQLPRGTPFLLVGTELFSSSSWQIWIYLDKLAGIDNSDFQAYSINFNLLSYSPHAFGVTIGCLSGIPKVSSILGQSLLVYVLLPNSAKP